MVESVKTHPSIAAAILERGQAAAGRVWLLLRAYDAAGRGWLDVDQVYRLFSAENSAWRLFKTRRRSQQILCQGEGVFWIRDDRGRLWLKGAAKVAAALSVGRLAGDPVDVPTAALLKDLATAKAAMFAAAASVHTTRAGQARPVTRRVLRERTGAAERTQRRYSKAAAITQQTNIAIIPTGDGETLSEARQAAHWRHGRGVFTLRDFRGIHGRRGRNYVAKRLPDSHIVPYGRGRRGRKSKINRELSNLVFLVARPLSAAMRGNCDRPGYDRIFHNSPAAAGAAYNRDCGRDHFWQDSTTAGGVGLWPMLPGQRGGHASY